MPIFQWQLVIKLAYNLWTEKFENRIFKNNFLTIELFDNTIKLGTKTHWCRNTISLLKLITGHSKITDHYLIHENHGTPRVIILRKTKYLIYTCICFITHHSVELTGHTTRTLLVRFEVFKVLWIQITNNPRSHSK